MIERKNLEFDYKIEIGISKEQWIKLLKDRETISTEDLQLLKLVYANKHHMATASQLIAQLNLSHVIIINRQVGEMGKKVNKKVDVKELVTIPAKGTRVY